MNDEYFKLSQAFDGGVMAYKVCPKGAVAPHTDPKLIDSWNAGYAYAENNAFEDGCIQAAASFAGESTGVTQCSTMVPSF